MTGIVNLFTCVCGKPAQPRLMAFAEDPQHTVGFTACEECLDRSNKFLAKVRPVFDKMIEIGVPRGIANDVMTELLTRVDDDDMLEPPSAEPSNSQ